MANTIILPTFSTEADRLTFLSRLWGVTLTSQDVLDWGAYKLLKPVKLVTESESEFSERSRLWEEGRVTDISHYILSKFEGYGLGKVRPIVEAYLATRPNPNRNQAREAVLLQLSEKWADKPGTVNAATQLLPLVLDIVW